MIDSAQVTVPLAISRVLADVFSGMSVRAEGDPAAMALPCAVVACQGVDRQHPRLAKLNVTLESRWRADMDDAEQVAGWHGTLCREMTDRFTAIGHALASEGLRLRLIRPADGSSLLDSGTRERGMTAGFTVTVEEAI
jgi:hypothetical protein